MCMAYGFARVLFILNKLYTLHASVYMDVYVDIGNA